MIFCINYADIDLIFMKRSIDKDLIDWKTKENRYVLLLRGARQVGKTYAVRTLAKDFEYFLEVNFEEEKAVHSFFEDSLNPKAINEKLIAYFGVPIVPGKTILFFDEIQACPNALRALRFYHEKMGGLHVVAAGSLLEFALEEIPSFGVGRIMSLFMYPMTFGEFMEATGHQSLYQMIFAANEKKPMDDVLHKHLLDRFKIYQIIGGMPAVVETYRQSEDVRVCQKILDTLLVSLQDDFAKYKKKSPVLRLREIFQSIPFQAGNKFKYSNVEAQGSIVAYKEALELLVRAGLAYKVYHTSARGIPLGTQTDPKKFKILLFDIGLHQRLVGLNLSELIILKPIDMINKGSLAETFVGLEIIAHSAPHTVPQLYYWHREAKAANAEIDYVIQKNDQIIPIEVKAGTKGQMQSLHLFLRERKLPFGIRISHENFACFEQIHILPIYAVEKLKENN